MNISYSAGCKILVGMAALAGSLATPALVQADVYLQQLDATTIQIGFDTPTTLSLLQIGLRQPDPVNPPDGLMPALHVLNPPDILQIPTDPNWEWVVPTTVLWDPLNDVHTFSAQPLILWNFELGSVIPPSLVAEVIGYDAQGNAVLDKVLAVPEPGTASLLLAGGLCLMLIAVARRVGAHAARKVSIRT